MIDFPEPEYDATTHTIDGGPDLYLPDAKGLGHAFYTHGRRNRNRIGQIDSVTGAKETFGSMLERSIRTALCLRDRFGIQPGDIISICASNSLDNFIPFIATQLLGGIVASLDPTISHTDTVHLVNQVQPKMIFVSPNAEELIDNVLKEANTSTIIVTFGDNNKYVNFSEMQQPHDDENSFRPYEVDDCKTTAVILFSSGTTGLSKGICVHHYGLLFQAENLISSGCVLHCMLGYATTYWISTVLFIVCNQAFGKTRLIVPKFIPKDFWTLVDTYKVTFMFIAPTQAIHILKVGRPDGFDTTSLRDIVIGGGPLSADNNLALRDLLPGTQVYLTYGQSEAAGLVTQFRPALRKEVIYFHTKPQSSGRPSLGYKYRIVNPETETNCGPNETGELRYFSNCQMNGYYARDSSEAFDEQGWVRTGDVAYYDDDLCFYIVDRIKEMLKFQAFHIPPAKIEGVLMTHPAVALAIVIGIPDEMDGDHPMGLVILQPDGIATTPDELVKYVEKRVDDRNRLRAGVKIIKSVPYTPSGKIKKHLLRKMVLNGEL